MAAARPHDVVVIGASAGGIPASKRVVGALSADLPAAVLVVLHVNPGTPSALPATLERAAALPVRHAWVGHRSGRSSCSTRRTALLREEREAS